MLLGLSLVSSQEQFEVHKFCFTAFILFASLYMCITTYLFSSHYSGYNVRSSPLGHLGVQNEVKSYHYKELILKVNAVILILMVLFYWLHNSSCRPYMYTLFALTEYSVVLLNMSFHMCAYLDFYGVCVEVPSVTSLKHNTTESRRDIERELLIEKEIV